MGHGVKVGYAYLVYYAKAELRQNNGREGSTVERVQAKELQQHS